MSAATRLAGQRPHALAAAAAAPTHPTTPRRSLPATGSTSTTK
ncbi:hypothetical protein [Cellulomonas sp. NS3]|nr:hypothetical protein [Cellulomonas sp. NS3]